MCFLIKLIYYINVRRHVLKEVSEVWYNWVVLVLEAFFAFINSVINKKKRVVYKNIRKASVLKKIKQSLNERSASLKGTRFLL